VAPPSSLVALVGAAVATGTTLLLAGVLAFGPSLFRTYLTEVLTGESHTAEFAGGLDPSVMYVTVRRPLAALFPATDLTLLTLAALVLLGRSGRRRRVVGRVDPPREPGRAPGDAPGNDARPPAGAVLLLLLYYPLVPLLYLLDPGRVRGVFVAGTVLLSAVISYPAVEGLLAIAPLPAETATALAAIARETFRFAQPPLIGALLVLAGCVLFQYEAARWDGISERYEPSAE